MEESTQGRKRQRASSSWGSESSGGFSEITNASQFKAKYSDVILDKRASLQPPDVDDSVLEYFLGDGGLSSGLAFAQVVVVDRELNKETWLYLYVYEILRAFLRHSALPSTGPSRGDAEAASSPSASLQLVEVEDTGPKARGESVCIFPRHLTQSI